MKKTLKLIDSPAGWRGRNDTIQPPALAPRLALELRTMTQNPKEGKKRRDKMKNGFKTRLVSMLLAAGSLLFWGLVLKAEEPSVVKIPHLINFQSTLTDPAGNPLADGKYNVLFRLLDASENSLYEEWQNLESQDGAVSAMVGSQNDLSLALLSPASVKFLSVQVEGQGPETRMEIVSVPYAYYAEEAAQVAPLSIGTEAIKPKSITTELLADDVLENLVPSTVVQMSQLESLKNDYLGTAGASKIGINGSFVYSQGGHVQNVLKDLDTALYQRQVNMDQKIGDEATARATADGLLQNNIDAVKIASETAIANSVSAAESENQALQESLQDKIDALPKIGAWANVNTHDGGSPSLLSKHNVESVTREGDGYRVKFETAISTPYVVTATAFNKPAETDGLRSDVATLGSETFNAGGFKIWISNDNFVKGDVDFNFIVIK